VLQESLTNVTRHSRADHVHIALDRDGSELRLEVSDNGDGFDSSRPAQRTSNGVTGMRERVRALGGDFAIEAHAGRGTTVSVKLPLECGAVS
jgi:signal transduction histidine kinase